MEDLAELLESASPEQLPSLGLLDELVATFKEFTLTGAVPSIPKDLPEVRDVPGAEANPAEPKILTGSTAADAKEPPVAPVATATSTGSGINGDERPPGNANDGDGETEAGWICRAGVATGGPPLLSDFVMDSGESRRQMRALLLAIQAPEAEADYAALLGLDDAILEEVLLTLLDVTVTAEPALEPEDSEAPPCKYHIMGKCFRSDCWYSHDLSRIPCKHLATGWCGRGDDCPFSHGALDSNRELAQAAVNALRAGYRADLDLELEQLEPGYTGEDLGFGDPSQSFPALLSTRGDGCSAAEKGGLSRTGGPGRPAASQPRWGSDSGCDTDLVSKLKLERLKKMFPVVWADEVTAHFWQAGGVLEDAIAALLGAHPGAYVAPAPTPAPIPAAPIMPRAHRRRAKAGFSKIDVGVGWVATGVELGAQYAALREAAIQSATARNRLFQEATAAFLRGDRRAAKELSRQGRRLDATMRAQHTEAAQLLFESRNRNGAGMPANVIDLHGLHVREAVDYLDVLLYQLAEAHRSCFIITGVGSHSSHRHIRSDRQARLAPAVARYLEDNGYRYRDASAKHGGRGGMFEVLLR